MISPFYVARKVILHFIRVLFVYADIFSDLCTQKKVMKYFHAYTKGLEDKQLFRDREDFKALIQEYSEILLEERGKISNEIADDEKVVSEIGMKKMYGGTYEVPCSVNGLPLKMIFDTGASDVTISSVEASFMLKNGYLTENDVKGKKHYMTASGDIHEGTILKLKEVKLGDAVLKNIEASVVHSQKAPLLLGQSVLEKFGTITIDNVNSKLLIKQ